MIKFDKFFPYEEMIHSDIGERLNLDNTPPKELLDALAETSNFMGLVRNVLGGHPIYVTSAYRSSQINDLVAGARNSDHLTGRAVDFVCPSFGSSFEICQHLRGIVKYSKMIYEYSWVHLSFVPEGFAHPIELTKLKGVAAYKSGIVRAQV